MKSHKNRMSRRALAVMGLIGAVVSIQLAAQQSGYFNESLEDVAARNPLEPVRILVDFHSIQREPQLVKMLEGSNVSLDGLRFKFVGSGGGGTDALTFDQNGRMQKMSVDELFDEAELQHRLFFQLVTSEGKEIPDVPCPIADEVAPTEDEHGQPGDPAVELACGLRIVEMRVSGTAGDALRFVNQYRDLARFVKTPSDAQQQRMLEQILKARCASGDALACQ